MSFSSGAGTLVADETYEDPAAAIAGPWGMFVKVMALL